MTVLTQDTARQFLGNSSTGEKYKLFMRGVQLSQLDNDYTIIEGQVSNLEATLESKKEALKALKDLESDAKNKVSVFERSARIEDDVKKLQNQFAWSQVKEQEKVTSAPSFMMVD
jgi:chromosome segregation ATPase